MRIDLVFQICLFVIYLLLLNCILDLLYLAFFGVIQLEALVSLIPHWWSSWKKKNAKHFKSLIKSMQKKEKGKRCS